MNPNITRYLNKTVHVSIPALFDDGVCRPYKLLGVELSGLWLQSEDLTQRLLAHEARHLASAAPAVFVPFAQIAGVLVATGVPAQMPLATANAELSDSNRQATETKPAQDQRDEPEPKEKPKKHWLK